MNWTQFRGALRPVIVLAVALGAGLWFFAADVSGEDKPSSKSKPAAAKTAAPATGSAPKPATAKAGTAAKSAPLTTGATTRPAAPEVAAQARPPAPSQIVMPDANKIVLLLRTSLLTLNDAMRSGNYSVLRDTAAPSFQQNSQARLAEVFAPLARQGIDLSAVSISGPQLVEAPVIDQNSRLRLKGYFPLNPLQINFEVVLEPVDGRWRLAGLAVAPVQAAAPVAQAAPAQAAPKTAAKAAAKKP
jgi:hypothetical protein